MLHYKLKNVLVLVRVLFKVLVLEYIAEKCAHTCTHTFLMYSYSSTLTCTWPQPCFAQLVFCRRFDHISRLYSQILLGNPTEFIFSCFLICIIYFIIVLGKPPTEFHDLTFSNLHIFITRIKDIFECFIMV